MCKENDNKENHHDFYIKTKMMKNLFNSSFITLFLYNGFQSLVQLSEEAKHQEDIPKSLISSLIYFFISPINFSSFLAFNSKSNNLFTLSHNAEVF